VTCEKRLLAEHVEFVKEKKMNVLGTKRRREEDVCLNDSVIALKRIALEFSSLPFDCVETTSVDVKFDATSSLPFSCLDGDMVVAPRVIAADQVFVRKLPQRARPGTAFYFELVFRDTNPSTWSTQLVSSLVLHAHVDVVLHAASASNATLIPLVATFTPLRSPASSLSSLSPDASFGVTVCIAIPDQGQEEQEQGQEQEQEPLDRRLSINRITIAGQSLQHQADVTFPVSFRVRQGMFAPQTIIPATQYMMWTTPAIALDATLYVATWKSPIVSCFTGDGVALEPLLLSSVGLSPLCTHAALDASSNTLLLADCSKLVAINTSSRTTLWQHASNILGITVLRHGIVLVSSSPQVTALRLCDGAFLSRTELLGCAHITSDAATAIVYITIRGTYPSVQHSISAYKWDAEHNALVFVAHVTTFTEPLSFRATTVVHVPRHSRSFLVGTYNTNTLHVFSLPDHQLIHVYSHPNMIMRGLAADPSGTAIAVCDGASDTVQVLPWPLPGMLMPVL
jgi:hypothetical protein